MKSGSAILCTWLIFHCQPQVHWLISARKQQTSVHTTLPRLPMATAVKKKSGRVRVKMIWQRMCLVYCPVIAGTAIAGGCYCWWLLLPGASIARVVIISCRDLLLPGAAIADGRDWQGPLLPGAAIAGVRCCSGPLLHALREVFCLENPLSLFQHHVRPVLPISAPCTSHFSCSAYSYTAYFASAPTSLATYSLHSKRSGDYRERILMEIITKDWHFRYNFSSKTSLEKRNKETENKPKIKNKIK